MRGPQALTLRFLGTAHARRNGELEQSPGPRNVYHQMPAWGRSQFGVVVERLMVQCNGSAMNVVTVLVHIDTVRSV
jgi:hypothetical protein